MERMTGVTMMTMNDDEWILNRNVANLLTASLHAVQSKDTK